MTGLKGERNGWVVGKVRNEIRDAYQNSRTVCASWLGHSLRATKIG